MTIEYTSEAVEILLVEDNEADVLLLEEGLKEAKIANNFHAVPDGTTAMQFLRRTGRFTNAIRPDIVLLDLNLPGKDGREVLREIKADSELMRIPVVVLTSSEAETDIVRSYESHANCFITKPVNFEGLVEVIRAIDNFWFKIVRLPG